MVTFFKVLYTFMIILAIANASFGVYFLFVDLNPAMAVFSWMMAAFSVANLVAFKGEG